MNVLGRAGARPEHGDFRRGTHPAEKARVRFHLICVPVIVVLALPARARAGDDASPVSERTALALGLAGTFVPMAAGGMAWIGMAVDDRAGDDYMLATYALAGVGLAIGPALAYAYLGKRVYAIVSAASRLVLTGLGVGILWVSEVGFIMSYFIIPIHVGLWAILDLSLIRHAARKINRKVETALAPWTDGRGSAGLALCGRF